MRRLTSSRPLRAAVAGLAAALAAAAPASAASSFTIRGAGFGHGVGMSQYGAAGLAKHGWDHAQILAHYFQGTQLGQAPASSVVRVLLASPQTARFTGATNAGTVKLDPGRTYGATSASGGRVRLLSPSGKTLATFEAPMRVTSSADAPIELLGTAANGVTNGQYRGWLEFRPGTLGEVLAINAVGLEQYTAGVIANEAIPSWPLEALEAQAVASRTYAITTSRDGSSGWDQYPDTRSQVYRGVVGENPQTNRAVNATRGQVVTYHGSPVTTFFFSTSGGRTENVEDSFQGATPEPYLTSVDDPYDDISPYHRWGPIRMTRRQAGAKLGDLVKGAFRGIVVTKRGGSPRIVQAVVVGSKGRTAVTGEQLKERFGLRDTWMTFNSQSAEVAGYDDGSAGSSPPPLTAGHAGGGTSTTGGAVAARVATSRITGSALPGRPGTRVVVQKRFRGRWIVAAVTHLGLHHRYRATVSGRGLYRVVVGGNVGPTLRAGA